jgi:uncharacterized protein
MRDDDIGCDQAVCRRAAGTGSGASWDGQPGAMGSDRICHHVVHARHVIVAIMEFTRGNLFAGAVFGTYGPFWVIVGAFDTLYAASVPPVQANDANSLLLAMFSVITFYPGIASLRHDLVLCVIIWLIFIGLVVLSVGAGANNVHITEAGGVIVLIFAILAWYHAAGDIIESTFGRKVLPFGPPPLR